jgi:hypothetical protein
MCRPRSRLRRRLRHGITGLAALHHLQASLRCTARRLEQEPRLANTGIPREQEDGRTLPAQVPVEQCQLVAATDQWGEIIRRHRSWHVWETLCRTATVVGGVSLALTGDLMLG